MSLVVFTAIAGLLAAPGNVHPFVAFVSIVFIALGGGASGALNMWYDADIDALMSRTKTRPVPSGRVTPDAALTFGLWVSGLSVLSMAVMINREMNNLERGMTFLASVGSTAPFIGLFGTVWGIYHALVGIGVSGQASIELAGHQDSYPITLDYQFA